MNSATANSVTKRRLMALSAFVRHWLSHKGQFIALLAGLASATALFIGVQLLNAEARSSYDSAEKSLTGSSWSYYRSVEGVGIPLGTYVALQRAGMRLTPVIDGRLILEGFNPLTAPRVVGYDVLTLGPAAQSLGFLPQLGDVSDDEAAPGFSSAAGQVLASLSTIDEIMPAWTLRASQEEAWPTLRAAEGVPDGTLYMDIAIADRLLGRRGAVDRLLVIDLAAHDRLQVGLSSLLKPLIYTQPDEQLQLGQMTASFHLNLTAFSLLSFLVGLFIVYSAMSLAYQDRLPLFRTLLTLGIGRRALIQALALELVLLSIAGGLIGLALGYGLAVLLMPGLAMTINGLYGAGLAGSVSLAPIWVIISFATSFAGAIIAGVQLLSRVQALPLLALRDGRQWQDKVDQGNQRTLYAGLALFSLLTVLHLTLFSLTTAFLFMAGFLLASAFLLPGLVNGIVGFIEARSSSIKMRWFWAEARADAPRISLALMALLLALSAHFGVKTMVTGYRVTFVDFLEERLSADFYLRADTPEKADRLIASIAQDSRFDRAIPIWSANTVYDRKPVQISNFEDDPIYRETWSLLSKADDVWQAPFKGRTLLISEQFARGEGLGVEDSIVLPTTKGDQRYRIAGVYADYGNTQYSIRMSRAQLLQDFQLDQRTNYGVILSADGQAVKDGLLDELKVTYGLADDQIIDQQALKAIALNVFNQTFKVSAALGFLTLIIASGALLASLLTLADHRLTQLAPLWGMGLTRRSLALFEALRTLALSLVTALVAMPVGLGVAYILIAHLNVAAFGWRLPFVIDPAAFSDVVILAVATAITASLWPLRRLLAISPAKLAKVFAHEG